MSGYTGIFKNEGFFSRLLIGNTFIFVGYLNENSITSGGKAGILCRPQLIITPVGHGEVRIVYLPQLIGPASLMTPLFSGG
jgi:hypothetical protein